MKLHKVKYNNFYPHYCFKYEHCSYFEIRIHLYLHIITYIYVYLSFCLIKTYLFNGLSLITYKII